MYKKRICGRRIVRSYSCPCGVIDIEESKVATLNPEKRQFMLKEDGMYCPVCHEKCILKEEQALVLNYAKIKNKEQRFIPEFLNKDAKTFSKMFKDSYQVITRKRNTGCLLSTTSKIIILILIFYGVYTYYYFKKKKKL